MYYVDEDGFPISISVDHIVSSKAAADEKDHTLLKTAIFSDPDLDGNISFGSTFTTDEAMTKTKKKSILRDTTNTIRNHEGEPRKNKNYKGEERKFQKDKVIDQVGGDKEVLEQPQDCVPIEERAKQSVQVATYEASAPVSEPVKTSYEDSVELDVTIFDSSLVIQGFEMEEDMEMESACRRLLFTKTVKWTADEVENANVSSKNFSHSYSFSTAEGDASTCMTIDSTLSEGITSDWKKKDGDLLTCGLEDNMVEIDCYSKEVGEIFESLITAINEVASVFSISKWQNISVKSQRNESEQEILII